MKTKEQLKVEAREAYKKATAPALEAYQKRMEEIKAIK
jgi:hypothetical protein